MTVIDPKMYINYIKERYKHHRIPFLLLFILTFMVMYSLQKRLRSLNIQTNQQITIDKPVVSEVLLLYVYADTHSQAYGNLKYFIDTAVREGDGVDYFFILQQVDNRAINESEMPLLKSRNAHYIQHENKCFDFGTYGWFFNEFTFGNPWSNDKLQSSKNRTIDLKQYKYFILMNASIRGPFFTPYFIQLGLQVEENYYWYSIFTHRINQYVKLVGCTISCEAVPHVQSYILVTDFTGLTILLKPGSWGGSSEHGLFGCYATKNDAVFNSELPASIRILASNYSIDSLLTKYQKVNFSEPNNRFCNANKNPFIDKFFEGASLEPYEVVFIKYNDLEYEKDAKGKAELYQRWVTDANKVNRSVW